MKIRRNSYAFTKIPPKKCKYCNTIVTVKRLANQCEKYSNEKEDHDMSNSLKGNLNYEKANNIVSFLYDKNLYNSISNN